MDFELTEPPRRPPFFSFLKYLFIFTKKWERGGERQKKISKQAPRCEHRAWRGVQSHKIWDPDLCQTQDFIAHPTEPPSYSNICHVFYPTCKCWTYFTPIIHILSDFTLFFSCVSFQNCFSILSHKVKQKRKLNPKFNMESFTCVCVCLILEFMQSLLFVLNTRYSYAEIFYVVFFLTIFIWI